MTRLPAFVARHPVAIYFALTFAISWGGALLAIGGSGAMRGTTPDSDSRFVYALIAMIAGPSTTGVVLTALLSGRSGVRELQSRLLTWRVNVVWYLVALLTAPVLMIATLVVLSWISAAFLPGIFTSGNKTALLLVGLGVGVSAGVFEEVGWTGFAIPTLRRRYGLGATGAIVGIGWSAWHLFPSLWSSRAASGDLAVSIYLVTIAVGVFTGYLTAFRILMVWVYDRANSLVVGMLMHLSLTASLLILNPIGISGVHLVAYSFALAGAMWVAVAIVTAADGARVRAQPLRRQQRSACSRTSQRSRYS